MIIRLTPKQAGNVLSIIDPDFKLPERFVLSIAVMDYPFGALFIEARNGRDIFKYQSKSIMHTKSFWSDLKSYFPDTCKHLISC